MTVLIVAFRDYRDDIPSVTAALAARGARWLRFDTDTFPGATSLSLAYGDSRGAVLRAGDEPIDLGSISAVWLRGFREGSALPAMEPEFHRTSVQAAEATTTAMLAGLGCFQLDPREIVRRAENKPFQLQLAQELGLAIPATLISNDPAEVRAFARSCPGGLVTKMVVPQFVREDGEGELESVYTSVVTPEELASLDGLHLCPMIFQERVPKALELRVTIVGRRVFTAAVDSQLADGARVDWRRDQGPILGTWRPHALPQELEDELLRLLDRLGLEFGGVDLILTPEGRHVFLEVNPLGSFSWLEQLVWADTAPISNAVADLLLGRAPPRISRH
ncbi:MvdD family ATP-grasp ribosomal peptide maturase [Nannocystis sp. RBIL2]|uniref:MvdC/MvdD family ATP grasp protein n=1 Tax=Nannocystis sp. RBIL2 TaxID=2996788 RepID=UPI002270E8C4|nr:MvdD family ATP-grasp ribosomal peptide maturase [Nannocystis sp. RBIL2]MCY1065521.1 MvdD family ATP-grasp ribosomal peptide maturase [Nannocystis sp. RBIL2]